LLLEEQLDRATAQAVSSHVGDCRDCQAALERLTAETQVGSGGRSIALCPGTSSTPAPFLSMIHRLKEQSVSGRSPPRPGPSKKDTGEFPQVAGYEIIEELGRGGMGVVYLAMQSGLSRLVALKMILAGSSANPKDLDRFRQEAEAIARLHHPNIVQIYDIGEADCIPYFALEFVEEGNLGKRIGGEVQEHKPAAQFIETLARAIHFAHQRGIVHRDLKPANILLANEPDHAPVIADPIHRPLQSFRPKITDFGLAKRLDASSDGTQTGEVIGTPSYMAPEQAGSRHHLIGPATDVYALGAILYEMLTGRPPFKGPTPIETVLLVVHQEPMRPSQLQPGLPRDLETICLKCLNKNPAHRYASAEALANDLYRFRKGAPIEARPIQFPERVWKAARRRPATAALIVGICASIVLGFAGIAWQWHSATQARDQAHQAIVVKDTALKEKEDALYYSRISRSQLQWRLSDVGGAIQSLLECKPPDGQADPRGWEWYYLLGLFHSDLFTFQHSSGGSGGNAAFHPDGRRVVSLVGGHAIDDDAHRGEVTVWDASTGVSLASFRVPGTAHCMVLRHDGERLALATTDGAVLVLRTATGEEVFRIPADDQTIAGVAFSPKGDLLAWASWDQTVKICDAETGVIRHVLRGHSGSVHCVAFHPDGQLLASGDDDAAVILWNLQTGEALETFRDHKSAVFDAAFSPDGKLLATGGRNGNLKFWDMSTKKVIQSLTGRSGAVLDSCFSPDGRYLAYCGADGTVRVWNVEAGIERFVFRGHSSAVESVRFSQDGRRLVSSSPSEGIVKTWDLTRHPEYSTFARVGGRTDQRVRVRDLTGKANSTRLARTGPDLEALAFHANGKQIVSVSLGGTLQTWDASTGLLERQQSLPISDELVSPAVLYAFSSDGERLGARAREDARVAKTWDVASGEERVAFRGHTMPISALRFSGDGRRLVTCACDSGSPDRPHEIKVWDAATGQALANLTGRGLLFNAAFSPDGRWIAVGGQDGLLLLADWAKPGAVAKLTGHSGHVAALTFSPNGRLLAAAGIDQTLKLYELEGFIPSTGVSPKGIHAFEAVPPSLCDLAFSPDGRRLVGITHEVVKIWEVHTHREVMTLRGAARRNWDSIFNPRVLFSPDGRRLVGTNWDESISMWDSETLATPETFAARRAAADRRGVSWHLDEAESSLEHHNRQAAQFHYQLLRDQPLSAPLAVRRDGIARQLPGHPAANR
ncbi:MAG TPA: protein kinase, partial [Urbifossiella sp.]|nr:protein kinase [Urbifossiella sp.]